MIQVERLESGDWLVVGDDEVGYQRWWGEFYSESISEAPGFQAMNAKLGYEMAYERRQFVVRFENAWSASVVWGSMTYSDNHDHGFGRGPYEPFVETPERIELGIKHHDELVEDGVIGYIDGDDLNSILVQMRDAHTTDHTIIVGALVLFVHADLPSGK